jgi:eukaryotic-like serine/threonine-protein kinase
MSIEPSLASEQERRLQDVLAAYICAMEAGEKPDRAALLDRHPDLANELILFFANQEDLAVRSSPSLLKAPASGERIVASPPAPASPKARIGDFEIVHEIARGGMGVVYRARQVTLGREVALKMILTNGTATPALLRRFRTEVEAAAYLDHPNIVPIYEVGEIGGDPYFTMKLVEGGSLSSRRAEFCLPIRGEGPRRGKAEIRATLTRSIELLESVARGVHHAHQRGVLHRDLKPGNILLDAEDRPMVADFGLAKRVDRESDLTQSQTILGTASYMAPEQARPTKAGLTVAADVYSLGAILYELLTGRPPIVGESPFDTLLKLFEESPLPPRQRNRNVPRDLEMVCLHCLNKEPAGRYGSALELAEDLERWRIGSVISLRPPTTTERAWRLARRHPVAVASLGVVFAALCATSIGMLFALNFAFAKGADAREKGEMADMERAVAESERKAHEQVAVALQAAEKAGAESRRLLVSGYVANGTRALDAGDPFGALVWYGEALGLDRGDAAREDAHRTRLAASLRRCPRLVQVWFDNDATRLAVLSPDGRRVALLHNDTARIWDVARGEAESAEMQHRGVVERAGFSPDGTRFFTIEKRGAARVWNASTGLPLTPPLEHDKAVNWATFSPDGTRLVTVGADKTAKLWDVATGKLSAGPLTHDQPVHFASFSRDGKHLVTCGGEVNPSHKGEIRVWDLTVPRPTARTLVRPGAISWAYLAPDGEHVVAAGGRRSVHLWPLDVNHSDAPGLSAVRLDPNGAVGAVPTRVLRLDGSTVRVYDVATAKPVGPPLLHGAAVVLAVFSPDGRFVATTARDRTARVWDAETGKPLTPALHHGRTINQAAFSADGGRLLTASEDGIVRVWDLAARDLVHPLSTVKGTGAQAISPDGKLIAATDVNGVLWIRETASGKVKCGPWKLDRPVITVLFAPDGRHVLAASDGACRIWDAHTGEAVAPVLAHTGTVQRIGFNCDGSRAMILGARDQFEVFDAATGSLQLRHVSPGKGPPGDPVLTLDGRAVVVVSRSGQDAEIREVDTGMRRGEPFRHAGLITRAALSPDGTRLAVATAEGTAVLWDVATGRPAAPGLQHGPPLSQVAFSGDGRRVVTVAEDHTARVWDVRTGLAVTPLLTLSEAITHAGLAADGTRLMLQSISGGGAVWDLSPDNRPVDDLLHLTRVLSGRVLDASSGGFEPMEQARLRDSWPELRSRYPLEFAAAP